MKQTRKKYAAEFKAKVALAALSNQMTLSEISEKYSISTSMISKWKAEFVANASAAFKDKPLSTADQEKEKQELYAKIGKLEMKLDFAKRVSKELGIPVPADD